jgi:hypothetical protein
MRRLSIASPPCVVEDFDGEIIALNLDTGLYFSLPGLAGAIWRDLNAGHPPEGIVTELAAVNDVLGHDAFRFINSLVSHGLLCEDVEAGSALPEPEYRALVERGNFDLTFTAHDDMKDLVMTDPIHEVNEAFGWPVLRDGA